MKKKKTPFQEALSQIGFATLLGLIACPMFGRNFLGGFVIFFFVGLVITILPHSK